MELFRPTNTPSDNTSSPFKKKAGRWYYLAGKGGVIIRKWYNRSIIDELSDMRAYMDSLVHQMEDIRTPLLPLPMEQQHKINPFLRSDLKVDVSENDSQIIVTADLIPGIGKDDISIDLINPKTLEIACERKEEKDEETEGYYMRERSFGSMCRMVPLPKPVTEEEGKASFKDGVLTVTLKKTAQETTKKSSLKDNFHIFSICSQKRKKVIFIRLGLFQLL
jgi:HSP20 family protein